MNEKKYTLETVPRDAQGWISINDLHPEFSENVIVCKKDYSVFVGSLESIKTRKGNDGVVSRLEWDLQAYDQCNDYDAVIYWQPLPKAPTSVKS
jgi:hypothetical protein